MEEANALNETHVLIGERARLAAMGSRLGGALRLRLRERLSLY